MVVVQGQDNDKFTYHLVNIKLKFGGFAMIYFYSFTYHLVNIKPPNKLGIFNTYTCATLLNLQ
ncbi:hypothetical protein DBN17_18515 [Clostridioides difficile]|nr:hypothetical protein [Clostridioides difficile]EGT4699091.1 hypothetical protein [Clostridioides difficile]EGT4826406.1 hypothetical protein [Clostridioides difficile]EGT4917679.1 hypothetical protein [Clostridioides difficile]EGT5247989.1 hypothetical protein [Clostridioides difficile]